jgi:hypothetical protein
MAAPVREAGPGPDQTVGNVGEPIDQGAGRG